VLASVNVKKTYVLDTNVVLHDPLAVYKFEDNAVVLPIFVIEEVDHFKRQQSELGHNARRVSRLLDDFRRQGNLSLGVDTENGGTLRVTIDDPGLREQALGIRRQIDEFRTIAQTRLRGYERGENVGIGSPLDVEFDDVWTDEVAAGRLKDPSFRYSYIDLTTPPPTSVNCITQAWASNCRIVINYETNIHPLWGADRPVLDPATGMPVLDRQPVRVPVVPPSLQGLPPRSVPETRPTPLQRHYINLSVVALVSGVVAISALELGAGLGNPLVKLCVLVGAPILFVTTVDAGVRIWRSAWAWMPVDRVKGLFRLGWIVVVVVGLVSLTVATILVLAA